MGQCLSLTIEYDGNPVNARCPVCKETKKLQNLNGRFFIINETECKCNGCNTVFLKNLFFS
jgi:hypothetical protein